jgi:hypothetical protein
MSGDLRLLDVVTWGGKVDGLNWLATGIIGVEYPITSEKSFVPLHFLCILLSPLLSLLSVHLAFSKL